MKQPNVLLYASLLGITAGALVPRAFRIPSDNGFPHPNDQQKLAIARQAGGKLPNSPSPTSLGAGTTTAFQLITFGELLETAFFGSLVNNITKGEPGYEAPVGALSALQAIVAQEEQHALGAMSILQGAGAFVPLPCEYTFPTTNFQEAIGIAETFTAVVLGALQDANVLFTKDGAQDFVRLLSSVIGQEGEQNGYYRAVLERIPSESPFLTTVPAPFAYSALQGFVVPGSCPFPLSNINLPIFPPIMTNGGAVALIQPRDQTLSFEADLSKSDTARRYVGNGGGGLFLTYTTGQLLPISVPLSDVKWRGSVISFKANFPYEENIMAGFSHAALTTSEGFASAGAVVESALAGPAIIQVDNRL